MKAKVYYYCYKAVSLKNQAVAKIATPKVIATLAILSQCCEPFKYAVPEVYAAKITIDAIKETGIFSLACGITSATLEA